MYNLNRRKHRCRTVSGFLISYSQIFHSREYSVLTSERVRYFSYTIIEYYIWKEIKQSTTLVLSRSTMYVQTYRVLFYVRQTHICKRPNFFTFMIKFNNILFRIWMYFFIIISLFYLSIIYENLLKVFIFENTN